ncbi:MAG: hypothetical protein ABJP45_10485 [Cyclobacteriaceae bacterium]
MTNFLRSIAAIFVGYLLFTLVNMGLVMLLFYNRTPPSTVIILLALVVAIPITSFYWIKIISMIAKGSTHVHSIIVICIVAIVTGINMYLGVSLEPFSYKIAYLLLIIGSVAFSIRKLKK